MINHLSSFLTSFWPMRPIFTILSARAVSIAVTASPYHSSCTVAPDPRSCYSAEQTIKDVALMLRPCSKGRRVCRPDMMDRKDAARQSERTSLLLQQGLAGEL